jgi:hypothetical protein
VWVSLSIAGEREKEIKRRNDNFHSILEPPKIDACADTALEEMQSLTERSGIEEKQARSEIFFSIHKVTTGAGRLSICDALHQ